jgi:AAA family ATP:ADP antiporter
MLWGRKEGAMAENPFKAIFNIKKEELPFSILMGLYFFLVITSFWIWKPIKKGLFINYYKETGGFDLFGWHMLGSQAELLAKILNMVIAAVAVVVFSALSNRFVRQQLTLIFSIFFIVCFLYFMTIINSPSGLGVWSFYLGGDLYTTLMVATFFAFLNDSVTPDIAKRIYGLTGFGGVAGGAVGATTVAAWIRDVPGTTWMIILIAIAVVIMAIAVIAGKMASRVTAAPMQTKEVSKSAGNPALQGAKLVFASRYLLAIVGIVGLYEMVSTIMDFQFTSSVEHFLKDTRQHFSTVFAVTNFVAMFVQLFLTSFVMTRFGVALLVLPVAALTGSTAFMLFPSLLTGSALNTTDNAFNYSINQSAKESLYVPTTKDEKYKAKAFIDMFVQRFAKSVAVGLSLLITSMFAEFSTIRWLSLLSGVILLVWIFAARYAGKKFDELTSTQAKAA